MADLAEMADQLRDKDSFAQVLEEFAAANEVPARVIQRLERLGSVLHAPVDAGGSANVEADPGVGTEEPTAAEEEAVHVTTFRKAKGLTAEVVVVTDLDDYIIPADEPDISEQRRLFYVSVTRAKRHLYLTHVTARYDKTRFAGAGARAKGPYRQRSRFLDELRIASRAYELGAGS